MHVHHRGYVATLIDEQYLLLAAFHNYEGHDSALPRSEAWITTEKESTTIIRPV